MNKPLYTPQALDRRTVITPAVKKRSISQRVKELGKQLPTTEQIIDFQDKYLYEEDRMRPEDKETYQLSKQFKDFPYIGRYVAPVGTTYAVAPNTIGRLAEYYILANAGYNAIRGRDPIYGRMINPAEEED